MTDTVIGSHRLSAAAVRCVLAVLVLGIPSAKLIAKTGGSTYGARTIDEHRRRSRQRECLSRLRGVYKHVISCAHGAMQIPACRRDGGFLVGSIGSMAFKQQFALTSILNAISDIGAHLSLTNF
jgi:hypothetical protein